MKVLSRLVLVLKDLWTLSSLHDVLREFVGTALFLFTSLASIVLWPRLTPCDGIHGAPSSESATVPAECHPDPLHVSLAFGASLTLMSVCLGPVHLNPTVTLALAAGLRISPWQAILYVAAQLLGALSACALLMGIVTTPLRGQLGLNKVAPGVYPYQAFSVETAITFQLVLCVLTTTRPKSAFHSLGPAVVGLSVTLGHLMAVGYTGCGMNPARSFGPAVVTLNFHNHWVYWAGPCVGAVLAWLLHDLVLHPRWGCPGDWLTEFKDIFLNHPQSSSPEQPME